MTEMLPTLINGKWTLILPSHRAARAEWRTGWEVERLDAMHESITRHAEITMPVVYDIGAEEGDMTALFAQWGARVLAVEPNPRVWPNIKAIFEANELVGRVAGWFIGLCGATPNCTLHGCTAVTDELDWPEAAFGPLIGDHGFVSLVESGEHVARTTIDQLAGMHEPPDIITMDVEGSELRVLEGAYRVLAGRHPEVFVSVHPDMMNYDYNCTREDLLRYMRQFGYRCEWLAKDHEEHWWFHL